MDQNLEDLKKIYFIGIGGIGMSATAGIAAAKGLSVAGSDDAGVYDPSKSILDQFKIQYKIGYNSDNFQMPDGSQPDLVVATPAVDNQNPEYAKAVELGIPIISFANLLGHLAQDKNRVVVTGTHGKGTTSGLISEALKKLNNSSFFVGAVVNNLNSNFYYGLGPDFVIEGDEYKTSHEDLTPKFNHYSPNFLLINNIEFDHPDLYPTLDSLKSAFKNLLLLMERQAAAYPNQKYFIIYNADDSNVREVVKGVNLSGVGFGFTEHADIRAYHPVLMANNMFEVKVDFEGRSFTFETKFPGMPYAYDNLAAISTLLALGHKPETFLNIVKEYNGVKRRYEIIMDDEITVIDDYAHHPTAVRMTLEATRQKYPDRRIICFFEPHTYSRTKETLPDLMSSFGKADLAYIAEVYPAREQKLPSSITGQQVVAEIMKNHQNVKYVSDRTEALNEYLKEAKPRDVVVVMAVGSFNTLVYNIKEEYLKRKETNA
jgi:UDP-N-acetylmuramate--L-alanine ligase